MLKQEGEQQKKDVKRLEIQYNKSDHTHKSNYVK